LRGLLRRRRRCPTDRLPPVSVRELPDADNIMYLITVPKDFVIPPSADYDGRALLFPAGQYFIPRRVAEDKTVRESLRQVCLEAETTAARTTASMPRYRSAWVSEAEIIAHIAKTITSGDLVEAREKFRAAACEGALETRDPARPCAHLHRGLMQRVVDRSARPAGERFLLWRGTALV
jgi:hypothetical protein